MKPLAPIEGAVRVVRVWDLPTRLFHWALLVLVAGAWVSRRYAEHLGDHSLVWHRWTGYAILTLLVFRLIWGGVGSSTARFSSFLRGPAAAARYLAALLRGRERRYLGHNPLGTWMIVALFLVLVGQAVLGLLLLDSDGFVGGPLNRLVADETAQMFARWHGKGFNIILLLAAIHIVVNSGYELIKRDPLVRAMISGRKPAGPYEDAPEAVIAAHANLKGLACLALAAAIVLGGITLLGGRL
jgi:cytochrome b